MVILHIFIFIAALLIGMRIGSIGIGISAGAGLLLLGLTGIPIDRNQIPFDVVIIILALIIVISAMKAAGGMDYLTGLVEKLLWKKPTAITYLGPITAYFMTILAGTGHSTFSIQPVVIDVAKAAKIPPSRAVVMTCVAPQLAILGSPISAAIIYTASELNDFNVSYIQLLTILMPATLLGVLIGCFVSQFLGRNLSPEQISAYEKIQEERRHKAEDDAAHSTLARRLLWIFVGAILITTVYSIAVTDQCGLIPNPTLPRTEALVAIMLTAATLMIFLCKLTPQQILGTSIFTTGMSAVVCVIGVAWLGTALVSYYIEPIKEHLTEPLDRFQWLLPVMVLLLAPLLYSQASTLKIVIPVALSLNLPMTTILAAIPTAGALFILPTYPTVVAAVEMDDTGSTKIGNYILNHSFIVPGIISTICAVGAAYGFSSLIL